MRRRIFFVYITMSQYGTTLYTGVTNDLVRRIREHREGDGTSFASKYKASRLVWFECHASAASAIAREKQIKGWKRARKQTLIRSINARFEDLSEEAARAVAEAEFRLL